MENHKRYNSIEKVGQGTYGAVYKSRDTLTNDVRRFFTSRLLL